MRSFFLNSSWDCFRQGWILLCKSQVWPLYSQIRCKTGAVFNGRKPGKLNSSSQVMSVPFCAICHQYLHPDPSWPATPQHPWHSWRGNCPWHGFFGAWPGLSRHLGMGFQAWEVELPWCLQPLGNWNTNPINILYIYNYKYVNAMLDLVNLVAWCPEISGPLTTLLRSELHWVAMATKTHRWHPIPMATQRRWGNSMGLVMVTLW